MKNNLYIENKDNATKKIVSSIKKLHNNVSTYINEEKMPILNGEIDSYKNIIGENILPEKGKDIDTFLNDFSKYFQRSVLWENPGAFINITPPSNWVSIVSSFYTALYNPNFAQDESSGYLMATELKVGSYLSQLVNWDDKKAGGIFTFGGKGTNLYAAKIGIKKAIPNVINEGISNKVIKVFSNDKGHPCHKEICDWLGLGKDACVRIPVTKEGIVNLEILEKELRNSLDKNEIIGCIIVNGGTTNEIIIDPIKEVVDLRDKLVKEYKLSYVPHIHVDAVIGWAWAFFKNYDFNTNRLNMSKTEIKKIESLKNKIMQIEYADSFGADFHKTGFCPYISSVFMAKDYNDVTGLGNKTYKNYEELKFGEYSPFEYTLELTRSSIGPVSAYAVLETYGVEGFQDAMYGIFKNCETIRNTINKKESFEVIDMATEGFATLFIIKPNESNKTYKEYVSGEEKDLEELLSYNHKFYLFCLKQLEEKKVHFKLTFSKSYKPFGAAKPTGAIKIYPTSPIVNKKELLFCLDELFNSKEAYDKYEETLVENREVPIDYVYRD